MPEIVVIIHDIRSSYNVGSLLRTCEGLGVRRVYLTGYTPYPKSSNDTRLPHTAAKVTAKIQKTALGAQESLEWEQSDDVQTVISTLKKQGYDIVGLEQTERSLQLPDYVPTKNIALVLGREVEGLDNTLSEACDTMIEIPMAGEKESFNVAVAAGMALYHLAYADRISSS